MFSNGFSRQSIAPLAMALVLTAVALRADIITTGNALWRAFSPLRTSKPAQARHLNVQQYQIWNLSLDERETLPAGRRADDVVAFVRQRHPQRVSDGWVVVYDKDAHLAPF